MKKTIYSIEHKHIIQQLKKARQESGLEQKKVARLLIKTQSFVSKIESGQRRVDLVQLKEFAKIYNKPLTYFIPH